ncbi:MAG: DUF853 family protein [Oscillospiraceae bacterium]|nr:DUF853 family protein [Oscillospiraceae bacterium]
MVYDNKILIGKSGSENVYIYPSMANRHGLIAGATGTGKTVTLKVMAESFSDLGVPVFLADAKGDLAGMGFQGEMNDNISSRVEKMGLSDLGFRLDYYPATFWDVYQKGGIPLRTTVSEMGPMLLSRILGLNETQSAIMTILFKIADDDGLLLIDTKDLKAMIQHVGENSKEYSLKYGNMSKQSLSAILRAVVSLEAIGGETFFAEPAVDIHDFFGTSLTGKGKIEILDCRELMNSPVMYATFMMWLISELFEALPEAGDMDKPRIVFFFDEAHMLFDGAPKVLLDRIGQMVKLIRSKGVGIYFITQSPQDVPDEVLAQLGNKVQHALRAYTPAEQKKLKAAAMSYRANPDFDTLEALQNLGVGEALVSVLDETGIPTVVKKCSILPPQSRMGAITDGERAGAINSDNLYIKYKDYVDNDSAYEFMERMRINQEEQAQAAVQAAKAEKEREQNSKKWGKLVTNTGKSAAGTAGRELGNTLGKTVGGSFGKKLGGNIGATLGRGLFETLFKK